MDHVNLLHIMIFLHVLVRSLKGSWNKIEEISKLCDLSVAQKTGQYVMAGFTYTKIDKYLKKLQDAGYTAVVITQDPNNPSNRKWH